MLDVAGGRSAPVLRPSGPPPSASARGLREPCGGFLPSVGVTRGARHTALGPRPSALIPHPSALCAHHRPRSGPNITSYTLRAQERLPNSTFPSCCSHSLIGRVKPVLRRLR